MICLPKLRYMTLSAAKPIDPGLVHAYFLDILHCATSRHKRGAPLQNLSLPPEVFHILNGERIVMLKDVGVQKVSCSE